MSKLAEHLRNLRRSRYFLPGVLVGAALGFAAGAGATLFATGAPQWRLTGSALAATHVALPPPSGGPTRLKPGATIICEGDSLTYGFARGWTPTQGGINGSLAPRSLTPYPEELGRLLGGQIKVVNLGMPGDRTLEGVTRWADAPSGQLAIIMYGANDAAVRGRNAPLGVATYGALLEALVRRRLNDGAQVIVLLPPPASARDTQPRLDPYRQMAAEVAARTGAKAMDAGEALRGLDAPLQYDGLHLSDQANQAIAKALASRIVVEP
ncbi:lysophospholipase L1-like esterase [Caulobacter sp. AP07]|uniref:SGNH/GDSL hydrolase family protein n=1 Tax=Caulobacter sp. AP07 TaxID=1144304 RepID=UPI000271ED9E|nr:SGNH/GDSL hydrolase family protein [Caulobacter sp. AP07]EJL34051.1 lysophospholipase L1-like esterase [Caulobacter sp. AP07]